MLQLNWPCRYDGKSATADFFLGTAKNPMTNPATGLPLAAADVTSAVVTLTDTTGTAIPGSGSVTATFQSAGIWIAILPADLALTLGTAYWINGVITLASGGKVYVTGVAVATMYQGEG